MAVRVSVMVPDGHVVEPVVPRGRRGGVRKSVGLVRQAVVGTEALPGADGTRPFVGVLGGRRFPLETVFFGSGKKFQDLFVFCINVTSLTSKKGTKICKQSVCEVRNDAS